MFRQTSKTDRFDGVYLTEEGCQRAILARKEMVAPHIILQVLS